MIEEKKGEKDFKRAITINIKTNDKIYPIIDDLLFKGKNIYNTVIFIMRQYYFLNNKIKNNQNLTETEINIMNEINADIERVNGKGKKDKNGEYIKFEPINGKYMYMNKSICKYYFKNLIAQRECCIDLGKGSTAISERIIAKALTSWFTGLEEIKDYFKNPKKYTGKPKLPNYKNSEDGRFSFVLRGDTQVNIKDYKMTFTYSLLKGVSFKVPWKYYKANAKGQAKLENDVKLKTVEFSPRSGYIKMSITYDIPKVDKLESKNRIAAIDLGISRLATVCNNVGVEPFMINGNPLKSINEHAYIQKAKAQRILMKVNGKYHSRKIDKINLDRDNKIKHYMHLSSTYIIRWCLKNKIDTLIVGKNDNWKQNLKKDKKLGTSKVRRGFVQIPFNNFISQLEYKCENFGINFILTEEGYTSKTSFLDGEDPYKESWNGAKRRKERGMYISDNGTIIHADLNGAYQIARKINKDYFKECKIHLQPRLITINNEILKDVV